jgi:acyl carrier protein
MNREKLRSTFASALGLPVERITPELTYGAIKEWDSVGHMALVAALETAFGVVLDIDDIIAMSSVAKAEELLGKYGVTFDAA